MSSSTITLRLAGKSVKVEFSGETQNAALAQSWLAGMLRPGVEVIVASTSSFRVGEQAAQKVQVPTRRRASAPATPVATSTKHVAGAPVKGKAKIVRGKRVYACKHPGCGKRGKPGAGRGLCEDHFTPKHAQPAAPQSGEKA